MQHAAISCPPVRGAHTIPVMKETDSKRRVVAGGLQGELRQTKPFRSKAQEATIALLRTASMVERLISQAVEPAGLSHAQYNVLRILRGAGADGLPTLEIRRRMIDQGASITRLLDRLELRGLVRRERPAPNRRQVLCYLTESGRALLGKLDATVDAADDAVMARLSRDDVRQLVAALETVRVAVRTMRRGGDAESAAGLERTR
jgi:DNA-binding MarR family transcriptional regulator